MNEQINVNSLGFDEVCDLMQKLHWRKSVFTHRGRVKRYDYTKWDWTKNNRELAAEYGMTVSYVRKVRDDLGMAKVPRGKFYPECLSWDWTKSDTEIAREHGITLASVIRWRRKLNRPPVPRVVKKFYVENPGAQHFDFSGVNWERPDTDIARELKCTRELVRQKRALNGMPKVYANELKYAAFLKAVGDVEEISAKEAKAKLAGFNYTTFNKYCRRAGIKVARSNRLSPWHLMNFQLPNKVLTEVWEIKGTAAGMYRARNPGVGRALFMWQGHYPIPSRYLALVGAEKVKAAAWKAEQEFLSILAAAKEKAPETPAVESHSQNDHQTGEQSVPV